MSGCTPVAETGMLTLTSNSWKEPNLPQAKHVPNEDLALIP